MVYQPKKSPQRRSCGLRKKIISLYSKTYLDLTMTDYFAYFTMLQCIYLQMVI